MIAENAKTLAERQHVRGAFRRVASVQKRYPLVQLVALGVLFVAGSTSIVGFDSAGSINAILVLAAILGFAAAGQTVIVLIGGLDLSVGPWIVAGGGVVLQLSGVAGWPFWLAIVATAVAAVVVGGGVGYVCHRFRIEPLVVTLAAGAVIGGVTLAWTKANASGATVPTWLQELATPATKTFGLSVAPLALVWAVFSIAVGIFLARTPAGRRVYATAMSPRAASLALVRTRRVWVGCFAFSAVMGAFAGLLLAGFSGVGDASVGDAYLWQSVTAVIVGGTAAGGRGDYWRTVLGSLLTITFSTVLLGYGASAAETQVLFGVMIFLSIGIYGRERPLRTRV